MPFHISFSEGKKAKKGWDQAITMALMDQSAKGDGKNPDNETAVSESIVPTNLSSPVDRQTEHVQQQVHKEATIMAGNLNPLNPTSDQSLQMEETCGRKEETSNESSVFNPSSEVYLKVITTITLQCLHWPRVLLIH